MNYKLALKAWRGERKLSEQEQGRKLRALRPQGHYEDPVSGAHEAFFDEVLNIAEDWQTFEAEDVGAI
jgi:hypothetical protein